MKFRAPTIVFKRFLQAGLIFGSAFAIGFFAWPWVAYGAVTLETFESYTLGNLNGQSSWASDGAQVVSTGGTKAITLDGYEYARKNYNVVDGEVFAIDLMPATTQTFGDYNYIRLCNGVVTDCTGTGKTGFIIKVANAGGQFMNVYNMHSTGDPDLLASNVPYSSTSTLYFGFLNGQIGFSNSCESYGCSMTTYDPYYLTDTVDDIDGVQIEANSGTYDTYYDNIKTRNYSDLVIDEGDSPFSTSTNWQYADGFSWQYQTCYMTNGVPESCSIEVHWRAVNDGNVAYLMSENRAIEYDSVEMDGATGRMDWLEVPATSTPGYATFDILIENLNGYYTDELMTVGWKAFESVYVVWEELGQTPDPRLANLFPECGDVCADVATDTDETLWQWMASGVSCGFQSAICYLLKPSDLITYQFVVLGDKIQTVWPYSLVTSVTGNIYTQDENGETIRAYETSTTTLDMSVAFPSGTDPIPVISNTMFEGKTEIEDFIEFFKEKVSFLLYALLFFYLFVRVMGTAWIPTPRTPLPAVPEDFKKRTTIDLRSNRGDSGLRLDLRKRNY